MKFTRLEIPDVVLIEPTVHEDARGFFYESYRKDIFAKQGIVDEFVQDNFSRSQKGTLRGLHFQAEPRAQGKLVHVLRGAIFDVAVDLRKGSKTLGRNVSLVLSSENKRFVYIPKGFAHGFVALESGTEVHYKTSDYYSPEHERGIIWNDPDLVIAWPKMDQPFSLSNRDWQQPRFKEAPKA